jgi:predicted CXXCH cytochrome family protein
MTPPHGKRFKSHAHHLRSGCDATRDAHPVASRWWLTLTHDIAAARSTTTGDSSTSRVKVTGGPSYLILAETDLCWSCHGSMGIKLQETYQHSPFATGHCTSCHDPHASDNRALLTQSVNTLCFTCHPIGRELGRAQAHPPAAQGWCIDCHDPHASEFKGILTMSQRQLCFSCHPSVAGLSGMPVQHVPFANDNCTGCHQPHGSDFAPLLNAKQPDICYDCHPGVENEFGQPSHHPVGLTMECGPPRSARRPVPRAVGTQQQRFLLRMFHCRYV